MTTRKARRENSLRRSFVRVAWSTRMKIDNANLVKTGKREKMLFLRVDTLKHGTENWMWKINELSVSPFNGGKFFSRETQTLRQTRKSRAFLLTILVIQRLSFYGKVMKNLRGASSSSPHCQRNLRKIDKLSVQTSKLFCPFRNEAEIASLRNRLHLDFHPRDETFAYFLMVKMFHGDEPMRGVRSFGILWIKKHRE